MLRGLVGQFSILFVPEHRYYRDLLFARLISAARDVDRVLRDPHRPLPADPLARSGSWYLFFCELAPGVILGISSALWSTAGPASA